MGIITIQKDPWFNLGFHLDHQAPYISFHLPGMRVTIGRISKPVYCKTVNENLWLLSNNKIPKTTVTKLRLQLEKET